MAIPQNVKHRVLFDTTLPRTEIKMYVHRKIGDKYSLLLYSQQTKGRSKPSVNQLMNGLTKCSIASQQNAVWPEKEAKYGYMPQQG